ncbi:hypothetical protein CKAH01_07815 [Colletotrichum kahawae]|uniref:Uncharacterized protein n=1 Tax=Colletotrichum kahawae TaxID=34407 RepID=A0AAD9Y4W6_COLKA|nr:hypothetical protein CKAH01_07815 [Colletotrichum kahawae]
MPPRRPPNARDPTSNTRKTSNQPTRPKPRQTNTNQTSPTTRYPRHASRLASPPSFNPPPPPSRVPRPVCTTQPHQPSAPPPHQQILCKTTSTNIARRQKASLSTAKPCRRSLNVAIQTWLRLAASKRRHTRAGEGAQRRQI